MSFLHRKHRKINRVLKANHLKIMASGKTHDVVTYFLLLPTLLFCQGYYKWDQVGVGLGLGWGQSVLITVGVWFGGIFLSPDLDIKSRPFYRWGPFRFIWWPYQWAIKHRSSASHGLLFAPLFRLVYLSALCIIAYQGLYNYLIINPGNGAKREILNFFRHHSDELVLLGIGICLGSLFHVILDTLSSGFRPFIPKRRG